jgi:SAM-dependent methyltransferase
MDIRSPVTGSYNTALIRDIDVPKIVELFLRDQRLDVRQYFHGLSSIQLRECNDTGYRFYYPLDIYGDDAFYQHLQQTGLYYLEEKWEYNKAASLIANDKSVLEIGSGAGNFMRKLKARKQAKLCGLELNTQQVDLAKKDGLDVINETIESFAARSPGSFDVAIALQVLEHVADVRSFIAASLEALKPGGQLIICVPNNNPYLYRHDFYHTLNLPPHHAGLWDRRSFEKLSRFFPMRLNGVFVESLSDYKEYYQTQVSHLREKRSPLAGVLSAIPAPIYKNVLRMLRHFMEGRNILVEFVKI